MTKVNFVHVYPQYKTFGLKRTVRREEPAGQVIGQLPSIFVAGWLGCCENVMSVTIKWQLRNKQINLSCGSSFYVKNVQLDKVRKT